MRAELVAARLGERTAELHVAADRLAEHAVACRVHEQHVTADRLHLQGACLQALHHDVAAHASEAEHIAGAAFRHRYVTRDALHLGELSAVCGRHVAADRLEAGLALDAGQPDVAGDAAHRHRGGCRHLDGVIDVHADVVLLVRVGGRNLDAPARSLASMVTAASCRLASSVSRPCTRFTASTRISSPAPPGDHDVARDVRDVERPGRTDLERAAPAVAALRPAARVLVSLEPCAARPYVLEGTAGTTGGSPPWAAAAVASSSVQTDETTSERVTRMADAFMTC